MANNATTKMLDMATADDIAGYQSYTIGILDNQIPTISDIDQYKLVNREIKFLLPVRVTCSRNV